MTSSLAGVLAARLGDEPIDDPVESAHAGAQADVAGSGQEVGDEERQTVEARVEMGRALLERRGPSRFPRP